MGNNSATTVKTLPQRVKEVVDFMYELLNENGWVEFRAESTLGVDNAKIVTALIKRGIIIKKRVGKEGRRGSITHYKWEAKHEPTKVLYSNIVTDIRSRKHKKKTPDNTPSEQITKPEYITRADVLKAFDNVVRTISGQLQHGLWGGNIYLSNKTDASYRDFTYPLRNYELNAIYIAIDGTEGKEWFMKYAGAIDDIEDRIQKELRFDGRIYLEPYEPLKPLTKLGGFSDQELWDELKKRGYTIEDNRLVIVKKAYLE